MRICSERAGGQPHNDLVDVETLDEVFARLKLKGRITDADTSPARRTFAERRHLSSPPEDYLAKAEEMFRPC